MWYCSSETEYQETYLVIEPMRVDSFMNNAVTIILLTILLTIRLTMQAISH